MFLKIIFEAKFFVIEIISEKRKTKKKKTGKKMQKNAEKKCSLLFLHFLPGKRLSGDKSAKPFGHWHWK